MNDIGSEGVDPVSSDELAKLRIEVWKKTIETQMHFNEMSAKARQLGLTFVVTALGLAVVLLGRTDSEHTMYFDVFGQSVHVSALIVLVSAAAIHMVRQLDLVVYHKMLRGAVAFGRELEARLIATHVLPVELGLTQAVSHFSQNSDAEFELAGGELAPTAVSCRQYSGQDKITAYEKISKFYNGTTLVLIILALAIFTATFKL
ncbi:MAG: hypothetical protein GC202_12430 [Alphaproteobacteria bacterium]|nr:hypothetical protein [Alphaproteobacteria bacterium]